MSTLYKDKEVNMFFQLFNIIFIFFLIHVKWYRWNRLGSKLNFTTVKGMSMSLFNKPYVRPYNQCMLGNAFLCFQYKLLWFVWGMFFHSCIGQLCKSFSVWGGLMRHVLLPSSSQIRSIGVRSGKFADQFILIMLFCGTRSLTIRPWWNLRYRNGKLIVVRFVWNMS